MYINANNIENINFSVYEKRFYTVVKALYPFCNEFVVVFELGAPNTIRRLWPRFIRDDSIRGGAPF